MLDTSPAQTERYFQLLKQLSDQERLALCLKLSQVTRNLALAGIREQHGQLSAAMTRYHLAKRLYGEATAERHFRPKNDDAGD